MYCIVTWEETDYPRVIALHCPKKNNKGKGMKTLELTYHSLSLSLSLSLSPSLSLSLTLSLSLSLSFSLSLSLFLSLFPFTFYGLCRIVVRLGAAVANNLIFLAICDQ
jgi:hypothetical protein